VERFNIPPPPATTVAVPAATGQSTSGGLASIQVTKFDAVNASKNASAIAQSTNYSQNATAAVQNSSNDTVAAAQNTSNAT